MDFGKGGGKLLTLTYESTPVGQAPAVEPSLYRASLRPVASMDPPQAPDELALLLKRIVTTLPPETHALVLRHLPTPELARLSCVHNAFGVAWRSLQQQHGAERYAPPSVDDFKAVKGLSRLERAAAFGDVAVIRSMVAAGVDKDRVVDKSLSHAAKHGSLSPITGTPPKPTALRARAALHPAQLVAHDMECWHAWLSAFLGALLTGPFLILALVFALWCAGFTALGVAGGSLAAVTQSSFPLVPASSWFACLQSVGALGVYAFHPIVYAACSGVCIILAMYTMYFEGCHFSSCSCHSHSSTPSTMAPMASA